MEPSKTNQEMMTGDFATINADANLKEAYFVIKKNLEGPPHSPGIIVLDLEGKYAGSLTIDDFMKELHRLYLDACDKPRKGSWFEHFADECEIMGMRKVADIMSGKRLSVQVSENFEKTCELILDKKLNLIAVVDKTSKPVGIITRRKVLVEIASRMFK